MVVPGAWPSTANAQCALAAARIASLHCEDRLLLRKPVVKRLSGAMFFMGLLGSFRAAIASGCGLPLLEACERGFKADFGSLPASRAVGVSWAFSESPKASDVPMRADSPAKSPAPVDRPVYRIESMTEVAWSPVGAGRGPVSRSSSEIGVPPLGSHAVSLSPCEVRDPPLGDQFETIAPGEPSAAGIVSMSPAHDSIPGCDMYPGRNGTPRPPGPDSTNVCGILARMRPLRE